MKGATATNFLAAATVCCHWLVWPCPLHAAAPADDAAATVAALRKSEQAAQKSAVAACKQAPAARAALIGSIAACRATHAEALR